MGGTSILARTYILMLFLQWTTCHPSGQEPVCSSRFDYESKMLERMLVVEHRMNVLQESYTKEQEGLRKEKQALEETVVSLKQQLENEQAKKLEQFDQLSQSLVSKVTSKIEDMTKLSKHLTEERESVLTDTLTKMETTVNATIKDVYDKTVKNPVAFHVLHPSNLSPGANVVLKFTTDLTNTDNVYDPASGYFTAPTPGVYMFAAQICGTQQKTINFRLFVNDNFITDTSEYDSDSHYHCTSTNAVAVLKEGDKVCVKTGPNTYGGTTIYSTSYRYSSFTGTLVH